MPHPGGRPLKFQSVDELQTQIDEYFATTPEDSWTWTGLAMALDSDRHTLTNYNDRPEFSTTIKKAMMKVEEGYEKDLKRHGRTGTIFALKNFSWVDKTEQQVTVNVDKELDQIDTVNTQKQVLSATAASLLHKSTHNDLGSETEGQVVETDTSLQD